MAGEESHVLGVAHVVVEGDDEPEPAVDGADAPDSGVVRRPGGQADVGGDLAVARDAAQQGFQGAATALGDVGLAEADGPDQGHGSVVSPHAAVVFVRAGHLVVGGGAGGETERGDVAPDHGQGLAVPLGDEHAVGGGESGEGGGVGDAAQMPGSSSGRAERGDVGPWRGHDETEGLQPLQDPVRHHAGGDEGGQRHGRLQQLGLGVLHHDAGDAGQQEHRDVVAGVARHQQGGGRELQVPGQPGEGAAFVRAGGQHVPGIGRRNKRRWRPRRGRRDGRADRRAGRAWPLRQNQLDL